jgi:hypothetical protein
MPTNPEGPAWKDRILLALALILLAAAVYYGSIFYRWSDRRATENARAAREVEQAHRLSAMLGGDSLKILAFYVAPGTIRHGERASLCYGVNGAKTVVLEPPVEPVWPTLTRCLEAQRPPGAAPDARGATRSAAFGGRTCACSSNVSTNRDTEYKLTATDGTGHEVSQSLTLKVAR